MFNKPDKINMIKKLKFIVTFRLKIISILTETGSPFILFEFHNFETILLKLSIFVVPVKRNQVI